MVATDIRWPLSIGEYFDTARSPLNPANVGRPFFVYGTLPLFLVRAIAEATGQTGYGQIHLVGRVLSGLFDLATVALTFWLGLLLAGPRASRRRICTRGVLRRSRFSRRTSSPSTVRRRA